MQTSEHLLEIAALVEHLDGKRQVFEPMLSHGRLALDSCGKRPPAAPMCITSRWTARGREATLGAWNAGRVAVACVNNAAINSTFVALIIK